MENAMTKLTREIVTDLWPLYAAGDASADTRALVEAFLEQDPEFARRLRKDTSGEILKPVAVTLPADHERATLLRAQRRRALQSMIINSLALVASVIMTAVYLRKVVPRFVGMFSGIALALPAATRFAIVASNWTVRLLPFLIAAIAAGYLFRRRIKIPESLRSGTALAAATGIVLLLTQLGWLALLNESSLVLGKAYGVAMVGARSNRAILAERSGDYAGAIQHFHECRQRGSQPDIGDWKDQRVCTLLMADAYLGLGDEDRAGDYYEEVLREVQSMGQSAGAAETAILERTIRSQIEALATQLPRLGIRGLDAVSAQRPASVGSGGSLSSTGILVASVNRGSPAFRAGLLRGDVIRNIDGVTVLDRSALLAELRRRRAGQEVRLGVSREDRPRELVVRLGRAVEEFTGGCERGYAEDCASLGTVYERGEGAAVDLPRAVGLYRRACDQGEPSGCVSLALMYERGKGVPVDAARAAALDRQSCEAGDAWGCNNFGVLQANGTGVTKDERRARGGCLGKRGGRAWRRAPNPPLVGWGGGPGGGDGGRGALP